MEEDVIELPKVITDFLADLTPEQASRVLTGRLNTQSLTGQAGGDGCLVGVAGLTYEKQGRFHVGVAFDGLCGHLYPYDANCASEPARLAPREVVEAIHGYLMGKMVPENALRADTLLMAAGISTVSE